MSNARTLNHCRKLGWLPWVVERRIPHSNTTRDLFGFADVLAVGDSSIPGCIFIQCTSKSNVSSRIKKIVAPTIKVESGTEPVIVPNRVREAAWRVLVAGNRIEVWGWHQPNGKGTRWQVRRVEILISGAGLVPYEEN